MTDPCHSFAYTLVFCFARFDFFIVVVSLVGQAGWCLMRQNVLGSFLASSLFFSWSRSRLRCHTETVPSPASPKTEEESLEHLGVYIQVSRPAFIANRLSELELSVLASSPKCSNLLRRCHACTFSLPLLEWSASLVMTLVGSVWWHTLTVMFFLRTFVQVWLCYEEW